MGMLGSDNTKEDEYDDHGHLMEYQQGHNVIMPEIYIRDWHFSSNDICYGYLVYYVCDDNEVKIDNVDYVQKGTIEFKPIQYPFKINFVEGRTITIEEECNCNHDGFVLSCNIDPDKLECQYCGNDYLDFKIPKVI